MFSAAYGAPAGVQSVPPSTALRLRQIDGLLAQARGPRRRQLLAERQRLLSQRSSTPSPASSPPAGTGSTVATMRRRSEFETKMAEAQARQARRAQIQANMEQRRRTRAVKRSLAEQRRRAEARAAEERRRAAAQRRQAAARRARLRALARSQSSAPVTTAATPEAPSTSSASRALLRRPGMWRRFRVLRRWVRLAYPHGVAYQGQGMAPGRAAWLATGKARVPRRLRTQVAARLNYWLRRRVRPGRFRASEAILPGVPPVYTAPRYSADAIPDWQMRSGAFQTYATGLLPGQSASGLPTGPSSVYTSPEAPALPGADEEALDEDLLEDDLFEETPFYKKPLVLAGLGLAGWYVYSNYYKGGK